MSPWCPRSIQVLSLVVTLDAVVPGCLASLETIIILTIRILTSPITASSEEGILDIAVETSTWCRANLVLE